MAFLLKLSVLGAYISLSHSSLLISPFSACQLVPSMHRSISSAEAREQIWKSQGRDEVVHLGSGARILNPVTKITLDEGSIFTLDTSQIKGVDSTKRETQVDMGKNTKLFVVEKLMTHGDQDAESNMEIRLNGEGSSAQIVSRSVAKEDSSQVFHPAAVGNNKCNAHIQCDSIIMDSAQVRSIPEINAKHLDAAIIHEAAIGRINDEQLIKLRTLGMKEEEAENIIIEAFLN